MEIRLARPEDGFKLIELYHEVYGGTYPDPSMSNFQSVRSKIKDPTCYWFVGDEGQGEIVASMILRYDADHLLAKAMAGVVHPRLQGHGILTKMMDEGLRYLRENTAGVDVVYATTRSVHESAQSLVERFGFKKIGIFPNTHKSAGGYETHSLAAWFSPEAFKKRFTDYKMHQELKGLFELVLSEMPDAALAGGYINPERPTRELHTPPNLEIIQAPQFVQYRYNQLLTHHQLEFEFFPFHAPNLMVISPDQSVEIFCNYNPDGHCVIIGGKVAPDVNYTQLISVVNMMLRDFGARYIELIMRADRPKIVESVLRAKMIPSAFFPAFQLKDGKRWDFVVFSRSFEIFDFQNVKLKGLNQLYLEEYFRTWERISLNPKMLKLE